MSNQPPSTEQPTPNIVRLAELSRLLLTRSEVLTSGNRADYTEIEQLIWEFHHPKKGAIPTSIPLRTLMDAELAVSRLRKAAIAAGDRVTFGRACRAIWALTRGQAEVPDQQEKSCA